MFYGQCWKCGERWSLGTASTCTCEPEQPQRTWVGLTDGEIQEIGYESADRESAVIQAEAKLKDKNTRGQA